MIANPPTQHTHKSDLTINGSWTESGTSSTMYKYLGAACKHNVSVIYLKQAGKMSDSLQKYVH